ncbi:hypothetical protein DPMN_053029 [Dreissena polymorpha]|uniref:Uncharacterized protein n=1 Tax=Dreissena polymorpha TaxID=45954 RepID=A0A9D4HPU5_DREPO|nr:hypothetical protein DPMN_053029 [Dreissena polymorpha]
MVELHILSGERSRKKGLDKQRDAASHQGLRCLRKGTSGDEESSRTLDETIHALCSRAAAFINFYYYYCYYF